VQVIYLTVDPERDNAARLKDYLAAFDPSFRGRHGHARTMATVRQSYGVTAEKVVAGKDYAVAHSSFVYLITETASCGP
jgi:protein SCO1/2